MEKKCIGIDVGGTTVKIGIFETDGTLVYKWEVPSRKEENGAYILPDVAASIRKKLNERGIPMDAVIGAGMGFPGPVQPDGYVEVCVNLGWRDLNPQKILSELLDGMPVRSGNDANVAALGEMWQGGGKGCHDIVMVTLGTGVGGGVVHDQKIVAGRHGLGGEIGHASLWRHGLWKKGLFLDDSQGDSKKLNYLTYKLKANFSYKFSAAHSIEANIMYMQDSPEFQSAFVSPRTRNAVTPGLSAEKVFGVDGSYNFRLGELRARVSGYYTKFMNQNKVLSYYDDVEATFSNFAMSGIDKRHFGVEVAASIPLDAGFYLNGALSWGQYTYDSNPNYVQIQDNSGEIKNEGKVYWKNFRVESTPQKAMNIGLSYRGPKNIYASLDLNYYSNMYISMSPLYRTDAVLTPGMTKEDVAELRSQEKFNSAYVVNASIGKNWFIKRQYTLGFSLEMKNLLNDQDIKTGGYEQVRLLKNKDTSYQTYQPFDSKYFYMFGSTYYLNLYFRF